MLAKQRDWKLSPAYDLTPSPAVSLDRRDLALAAGDAGRYANAGNLLSQSIRFLVKPDDAKALIDEMEQKVKQTWYDVCRREGVSERDCGMISGSFAYGGFRLPIAAA
jgi:serine/threonine-protein kinase HipA